MRKVTVKVKILTKGRSRLIAAVRIRRHRKLNRDQHDKSMALSSHLARSDAVVQSQTSSIILRIYIPVPSLRGASCKVLAGVTGDYPG